MTTDRMVRVSVRILEKEYQVACLPIADRAFRVHRSGRTFRRGRLSFGSRWLLVALVASGRVRI